MSFIPPLMHFIPHYGQFMPFSPIGLGDLDIVAAVNPSGHLL
jgi:hypothetical protein